MNEQLPAEKQTKRITPLDVANAAMRRRGTEINTPQPETHAQAGDIVERGEVKAMFVPRFYPSEGVVDGKLVEVRRPYTYRQFYSHSFQDEATSRMMPAPGWDSRYRLSDNSVTQSMHGRSFSPEEMADLPNNLPDEDALFLLPIDSDEVREYQESIEQA